jgi:hypothetical protein
LFALLTFAACAHVARAQQSVTLHAPRVGESVSNDSKSLFNFESGTRGKTRSKLTGINWDLGYGLLAINDEDWFSLSPSRNERSVIKDLGELNWFDSFKVPALTPLPELEKGKERVISVDSSADTHKNWEATNAVFAKAIVGHMYVVRIKRENADFYALFRVEEIEQRNSCRITWSVIPSPEQ